MITVFCFYYVFRSYILAIIRYKNAGVSTNTCERQDSTGDGAGRWRFYLNAVKHMDWRALFHTDGVGVNLSLTIRRLTSTIVDVPHR